MLKPRTPAIKHSWGNKMKIELFKGGHVVATGSIGEYIKEGMHVQHDTLDVVLKRMLYNLPSRSIGDNQVIFKLDHEAMVLYKRIEDIWVTDKDYRGIPILGEAS
jgi:hypothetical protein